MIIFFFFRLILSLFVAFRLWVAYNLHVIVRPLFVLHDRSQKFFFSEWKSEYLALVCWSIFDVSFFVLSYFIQHVACVAVNKINQKLEFNRKQESNNMFSSIRFRKDDQIISSFNESNVCPLVKSQWPLININIHIHIYISI